jgi:hypothetical protein
MISVLTRILKLQNPNAQSFTHAELQKAVLETIASLNQFLEEAGVNEVSGWPKLAWLRFRSQQTFHSQA